MFREIIARRIRRTKGVEEYRGRKTPILDEIPRTASVYNRVFSLISRYLGIERGAAYGEEAGKWYKVYFSQPLKNPSVVAVGVVRGGRIFDRVVDIPRISIPTPSVSVSVPTIEIPRVQVRCYHCRDCDFAWITIRVPSRCLMCESINIEELTGDTRFEDTGWHLAYWNNKRRLGDWGWFNWLRDAIATAWTWFGYYFLGKNCVFVLLDVVYGQVDYITQQIQTAFNILVENINSETNRSLRELARDTTSNVQEAFNSSVSDLIGAVNERLRDLYAIWGIPESVAPTVVNIRNVTSRGFEFLSLGKTTVYWLAVGEPGVV